MYCICKKTKQNKKKSQHKLAQRPLIKSNFNLKQKPETDYSGVQSTQSISGMMGKMGHYSQLITMVLKSTM